MKLKPWEESCDKCEGYGTLRKQYEPGAGAIYPCDKCKGTKKLDWLEKIYGKKLEDCCGPSSELVFIDSEEKMYKVFGIPGQ